MTVRRSFDDRLVDWLREGADRAPADLLADIIGELPGTPQRAAWPWRRSLRVGPGVASALSGRLLRRVVALTALLLIVLGALIAVSGSRRSLPAPASGPARNGQIAYVEGVRDDALGHVYGGTLYLTGPDGAGRAAVPGGAAISIRPEFSPDGTRIAFSGRATGSSEWRLYAGSADGSGVHPVTDIRRNGNPDTAGYFTPTWSPDGTRLAYDDLDPETRTSRLYVTSADAAELPTVITDGRGGAYAPRWSPDGRWIAHVAYQPASCQVDEGSACTATLAIVRPDGRDARTLRTWHGPYPSSWVERSLAWSPDSSRLAVLWPADDYAYHAASPADGHLELLIVDLAGSATAIHRSTDDAFSQGWAWSPDGRWLAFDSKTQIEVMPGDGTGQPVPLLASPHGPASETVDGVHPSFGCWFMSWSPDGKDLLVGCDTGYGVIADPTTPGDSREVRPLIETGPPGLTGIDWQRLAP